MSKEVVTQSNTPDHFCSSIAIEYLLQKRGLVVQLIDVHCVDDAEVL